MIKGSRGLALLREGYHNVLRFNSSKSFLSSDIQISFTDDGRTIACYHPEPRFPYEHTRPLPKIEAKFKEEDSVLKTSIRDPSQMMYQSDYTMNELVRLTHVSPMQWKFLPNYSRRDFQKEHARKTIWDKKDREGI